MEYMDEAMRACLFTTEERLNHATCVHIHKLAKNVGCYELQAIRKQIERTRTPFSELWPEVKKGCSYLNMVCYTIIVVSLARIHYMRFLLFAVNLSRWYMASHAEADDSH